jgi:hypothetical protein
MLGIIIVVFLGLAILAWKKPFWALILLVALIPFYAFLVTYLTYLFQIKPDQNFWLAFWKEWVLLILLIRIIWDAIREKKFPFKILTLDYLIMALFVLSVLSILWGTKNLTQGIWGLRYDFELFGIYWIVRAFNLEKSQIVKLVYIMLAAAFFVVVFGILQVFVLSPSFLEKFGYSYALGWSPDVSLQSNQVIGSFAEGTVKHRIISTLSGPNQLGSYLVIIISLAVSLVIFAKNRLARILSAALAILALIPLYYTYSRSAWLAFLVSSLVILFLWFGRKILWFYIVLAGAGILAWTLGRLGMLGDWFNIVLARGSTLGHWDGVIATWHAIRSHPAGLGVGKAGPLTLRFPENGVLINESWHWQILTEVGWLGLALWIWILVEIYRNLVKIYKKSLEDRFLKAVVVGTISAFSGLLIHGFFLHTWTDITTTMIMWVLVGVSFGLLNANIDVKAKP